jgi:pimeloyl-ACP methyl ester carboxylesterase
VATTLVNGVRLTYSDSGGDGPALILGHGYFLDHTIFAAQAAEFAPPWRMIHWDARGHGGTSESETGYTYWDQARDVLGLMDHLGVERAVVGGVSQGGFIALRTALLAPERVGGLVLWDTEATPCDPGDRVAYRGLFDALIEHGPVDDLLFPLSAQLLGDHEVAGEWRDRWRSCPALPLGHAVDCLLDRDDVSGRLGEITCPVLLMWGEFDHSLPRDRMELLAERLPAADGVQVIGGAAHTPPLTHPAPVNKLLAEFLPRCR